jgi:hypothetical protein
MRMTSPRNGGHYVDIDIVRRCRTMKRIVSRMTAIRVRASSASGVAPSNGAPSIGWRARI